MAIKGQHEGPSWWWEMSVSWPYQCQYPSCDVVFYHVNIIVLHHACISTIISKRKVQLKLINKNLKLSTNTIIYCLNSQIPTPFFSKLPPLLCQMSTFTNLTLVNENNLYTIVFHTTNYWDLGVHLAEYPHNGCRWGQQESLGPTPAVCIIPAQATQSCTSKKVWPPAC